MIQDKCYNVHQDLRSLRETLSEGLSRFPDCKKLNKLVKKFEEDFNKKDLVRNDKNDDTTGTTKDKNDLLHSDSKMESDSPTSDDDNQKSNDDDDDKQDVVLDNIDEQNKEDCVEIGLTFKRHARGKKSVMDNENKDAEAIELSSSIKRCGHPIKNTNVEQAETQVEMTEIISECHIDVDCSKNEKETSSNQTVEHNDTNEDTANTDLAFDDIREEQNNDDSELSNNADGKSEKEDEKFDALAITICNVCHHVPLQDSESEKEEFDFGGDTDNEKKYDPKKDADYKGGFYKSPYELKLIEPKIHVSASEKLVADTLFAMMYKPRTGKMMTKRRGNIASKSYF
nr:hypothetical protein [Tanacetum cinerariifolium]